MDWPGWIGNQSFSSIGNAAGTSSGTVITAPSGNTKSSYQVVSSSTPIDADWITIFLQTNENIALDFLVDIGIGPATEKVLIENLQLCSTAGVGGNLATYSFPFSIPVGSRITARAQSNAGTSRDIYVLVVLGTGVWPFGSPHQVAATFGATTGDSGGVSIDPGSTIHTKGSWQEIASSVSLDIQWLVLGIGNQANGTRTTALWLLDIGIGANPNEKVILQDLLLSIHSSGDLVLPSTVALPVHIPVGSRLCARAQCSINDATDRLFDLIVYGVGN